MLMVNYMVLLMTTVHYCACMWLYMGDKYLLGDKVDPWLIANSDFHNQDNWTLYIFSMYWILVCITTVGFGDYTAGTSIEILYVLVLEFIGLFCFSVLMSNV